jgi:hypothetical protein
MSASWRQRIHHPSGSPPLSQVQVAVENLADLFGVPASSKARVVFQAVADVALLGTVVVSGALATVHLYRTLSRRHKEELQTREPADGAETTPHRHGPGATASLEERGGHGHEDDGARSR